MLPASRFKRVLAYCIDSIISSLFLGVLIFILVPLYVFFFDKPSPTLVIAGCIGLFSLIMLFGILYFTLFECSKYQATPGKKLLNLYVSDLKDKRITFKRALGRLFFLCLPGLFMLLVQLVVMYQLNQTTSIDFTDIEKYNYWWIIAISYCLYLSFFPPIFFTKTRSTLYDMLSSTRVNKRFKIDCCNYSNPES